jgi:hypothetical protein
MCVHTPHVGDTGRSLHGAGPGATIVLRNNNFAILYYDGRISNAKRLKTICDLDDLVPCI